MTQKVITVKQPFASLIVLGKKTIEMRSQKLNYRGPMAIHAGISTIDLILADDEPLIRRALNKLKLKAEDLPLGAIIGEVHIADCVTLESIQRTDLVKHAFLEQSYKGSLEGYAWQLSEAKIYEEPIPARGKLGIWYYDSDVS